MQKAGEASSYSKQLLKQQLVLFCNMARAPDEDVLRKLTLIPDSLRPATERYMRKIGRPRQEWAPMLLHEALRITGSYETAN